MLIPKDLPDYRSYLLRFWHERSLERVDAWRFSLEDPRSGKRRGFDSLVELMGFLEEQVHPPSKREARGLIGSEPP